MRADAVHPRPGTHRARAMLAVGREDRIEVGVESNGDTLPVTFVRLPEHLAARAPVIERVEQPVAHEIAGRAGDPGRRRRSGGNVQDAPVEVAAFPVAESWRRPFVTPRTGRQRAREVEAVTRRERATGSARRNSGADSAPSPRACLSL